MLALDRAGFEVLVNPTVLAFGWQTRLPSGAAERIEHLLALDAPSSFVHVMHGTPHTFRRHPQAALNVGRTMLETDSLPPDLAALCEDLDEIWVPSDFNLETFARGGVATEKLFKVRPSLEPELYDPALPGLELALSSPGFVFLSVFNWGLRKGGDLLVRAYLDEFGRDEDVTLAIKTDRALVGWARAQLDAFVRLELARDPAECPQLVLLDLDLGHEQMPRLYAAADAYVMPSRGEGWGRPYMEAMAMGLPTIGTRWSGNLEFMSDDNSYLIDCELVSVSDEAARETPIFAGQRWAEPSLPHLRGLMRRVFEERAEAKRKGSRARQQILAEFTQQRSATAVIERLHAHGIAPRRRARTYRRTFALAWEGPQFIHSSLALVNRELCRALLGTERVELSLVTEQPGRFLDSEPAASALAARVGRALSRRPDAHVRLSWPPDFRPPEHGRLLHVLPWELGSLPRQWLEPLRTLVDEVWAPSSYVRDCLLASGLEAERVVVVPHGVNPLRFNPHAPPLALPTEKAFRFLFVGGTVPRKGADILLETYLGSFRADDDVCLVIKDMGVESFYRGQGLGEEIRRLQADPANPELLYLDGELPDALMPSLYRACHCLVAPYRGEGFCLPLAEAMACALPVIATAYGACLDFCDPSVSYLVPARAVRAEDARIGEMETVDPPWWAEVDRPSLARLLQEVRDRPEEAAALGARASERILHDLTWKHAANKVLDRLEVLADQPPRRERTPATAPARRRELSVCMIVKDEEALLPRCLESVRGLADEVIVVDTGSTDGTVEVARESGAQIHRFTWREDFAAARNESLRYATKDWILVLDADERLDPGSYAEVRRIVQTEALAGYTLRTLSYMDPEGTDSIVEHLNLRLFPNHSGVRFVGRDPHAQLRLPEAGSPLQLRPCAAIIHHEGYRPQLFEDRGKGERNRLFLERAVEQEPANPFHAFNLGVTYYGLGRDQDAERLLSRAIALCTPQLVHGVFPLYLLNAHLTFALTLFRQERYADAAEQCRAALRLAPDFADAHAALAAAEARLGRLEDALAEYERALQCNGKPVVASSDRSTAGWRSLAGMAEIYLLQERWSDALTCLKRAHVEAPGNGTLLVGLAEALRQLDRPDEAEEQLRKARQLAGGADVWI